jgi:hypothetical protein
MQSKWNENKIFLRGHGAAEPTLSHVNRGLNYYVLPLAVKRLSGAEDRLNVLLSERQKSGLDLWKGIPLAVRGEVRTFNNRSGTGRRLVVSVFAREIFPEEGRDENHLELSGTLCKPPVFRTTPLGRSICDLILAVNRRYGRADYLPCIAWGSLAYRCGQLSVGDRLSLTGRLQSRVYTKQTETGTEERVAFEVSVMTMEREEKVFTRTEGENGAKIVVETH